MIPDFVNSAWGAVQSKIGDAWISLWAPISDSWPLWWSYGVFGLILLGAIGIGILIRLFLPSDWAKIPLITMFVAILAAVGWLFGRVTMHHEMKAKLDAERARKNKPAPKPKPPNTGWSPFG